MKGSEKTFSNTNQTLSINIPSPTKSRPSTIVSPASSGYRTPKLEKDFNLQSSKTPTHISFGERLYRKSIAIKESKETKTKNYKQKEEQEYRKRCSFKPQINDNSCLIFFKSNYETGSLNNQPTNRVSALFSEKTIEEILPYPKKEKKIVESFIKKREEDELKELKSSPKKSKKEVEQITNKLYKEAEVKKVMKELNTEKYYTRQFPFTPKISSTSKPKLENFFERLSLWVEKRTENQLKSIDEAQKDSTTGQKLFNPLISHRKSSSSHKINQMNQCEKLNFTKNVFIDLYEKSYMQQESKREFLVKYEEELNRLANSCKATRQIEEIHNTNKFECFKCLFNILDYSQTNQLAFNEAFDQNLEKSLDPWLRKLLLPLINELKEQKEVLYFDEFLLAMEDLYKIINVDEKRKLVNWYVEGFKRENSPRKKRANSNSNIRNLFFKPKINEKSEKLLKESARMSKDFTQRNLEFVRKKEIFLNEKNSEKVKNEVKECTFRPSLVKK